jgi:hypothetical protein
VIATKNETPETLALWGKETRFNCRVGAVFGLFWCAAR